MPDDQPANLAGDHDEAVALTPLNGTRSADIPRWNNAICRDEMAEPPNSRAVCETDIKKSWF
jgi:hypothetical protein